MINGMAELLEQHRLDLVGRGDLQPGGIEVDAWNPIRRCAGVSTMDTAKGAPSEDLEADPQPGAAEAGLQGGGGV